MGVRGWRKLVRYLVEMRCFFGPFGDHLCSPKHVSHNVFGLNLEHVEDFLSDVHVQVFWKLDSMESSLRMRQCLRRNYTGSDHPEAAANLDSALNAPFLAVEAIPKEIMYEDDEYKDANDLEHEGKNEERMSGSLEDAIELSSGISDPRPLSDQDVVQNSREVVLKELDERIVLEISSSMVRPLRVVKGTFQVYMLN